ncbi:MAG: relaxase/mobilization nuclease domain-containing protein [Leptolyngbyaceae cyanobacterium bins.302]|nr:relaxase/mobilization nuclease domain-containing protein [Leptolyngbyaceae cyanobacterium bins.302]
MIGKQVKGRDFGGCIRYVLEKENAEQIGGNLLGETAQEMTAEFNAFRSLNVRLNVVVYHATLSVPAQERQTDEQWRTIAADYLQGMGFQDCQYLIARHNDQQHDHIHIIASRIRLPDGKTVSDSWDYRRSETLIRELEQQHNLTPTPSSRDRLERAPTTGEMRKLRREQQAFEADQGDRPNLPTVPTRTTLQTLISQLSDHSPSLPYLIAQLQNQGVEVRLTQTKANQWGISYRFQGQQFSGTQLGKAYTLNGLQHYKGIHYEPIRDNATLIAATRPANESTAIDPATATTDAASEQINRFSQPVASVADDQPRRLSPRLQSGIKRLSDAIVQYLNEQALKLLTDPIRQITESLTQFADATSSHAATANRLRTTLADQYDQLADQLAQRRTDFLSQSKQDSVDSQQSTNPPQKLYKFKPTLSAKQNQLEL